MAKWRNTILVVLGAMVLSTVAIQASDIMRGINGNLAGVATSEATPCGKGAVLVNLASGALCVDQYEASPNEHCAITAPQSGVDSQSNMNEASCAVTTGENRIPWRFVSLTQAQQLCARSGKRLPTTAEWYALAVVQGDQTNCAVKKSTVVPTGSSACATATGINDMIGNVWEWVDGQVTEGQFDGRNVPESGYVALVDQQGIVLTTGQDGSEEYGLDYAKTSATGIFGIIRGGFYGSNTDGGIFAQNLAVPLDLKTDGVGFRCVKNL